MKKKERTIAIFTLVTHKEKNNQFFGYAPYISEMNMWTSHFDKVNVVGHFDNSKHIDKIESPYQHPNVNLIKISTFNIKSPLSIFNFLVKLPGIVIKMIKVMRSSDYLHFRSPSNVAAIAAVVQIFFPSKPKSTKYAGNWDPKSKQPLGYRFQKTIFRNTFLSRHINVLVYGEWPNETKNVKSFISATYAENEKIPWQKRTFTKKIKFVFIGAMVVGKRPLLTVKIIEALLKKGFDAELHMFGDGPLIDEVKDYVKHTGFGQHFFIHGNQPKEQVKSCLLEAHFSILPSKSEGWPKAIAEGMFFGAIPISTKISCLPLILDFGNRGILIESDLDYAVKAIIGSLNKGNDYLNAMSKSALKWSQQYTVDRLEEEISKLIKK